MNFVCLCGNLTEDVKVYTTTDGIKIVKGVVAIGRRTAKKSVDYISFTVIGNSVNYVEKNGKKGAKATIQGSWNHSSFKDKEGNYRAVDSCLVEEITIFNNVIVKEKVEEDKPEDIPDDDLPF